MGNSIVVRLQGEALENQLTLIDQGRGGAGGGPLHLSEFYPVQQGTNIENIDCRGTHKRF